MDIFKCVIGVIVGWSFSIGAIASNVLNVNGAQLEYDVNGTGDQIVLFEAGTISGIAGWDSIWSSLPGDITGIRYSRRGEGKSSACEGNLTAKEYVDDLDKFLAKLEITKPIIIVSHSYGAKIARLYAQQNPQSVNGLLFVDPMNPRDIEIIETLNPINGKRDNLALKNSDIKMGQQYGWCMIEDIWKKTPSIAYPDINDIPVTLIAGVKKEEKPKRLFDSPQARALWGQFQSEYVMKFPQGKIVMATKSGHFVQNDEPEIVINELNALLERVN